jgi:tetratricopeptide (TPR) repeat protein
MPSAIQLYRIFIASPGGLADEREAFKETIIEYNDSDAIERNAIFLPIGWELTLAGIGRPQALINNDLAKCDYCILVLWDRWGTPPDNAAKFTSGTEEEFNIAVQCFQDPSKPMRQIVVLFKSVDPRQLSDPGPELRKVLEFKKKLESERGLLFDSFDEISTFRKKLRRHLASWTRDHESGELGKATAPRSIAVDPIESAQTDAGNTTLEERVSEDETALAKQVAVGDLKALQSYGKILALTQRIPKAREVFEKLSALPQTVETLSTRAASLRELAKIAQEQGSFAEAEELFKQALATVEQASPKEQENKASYVIDLGYLCVEAARFKESTTLMEKALDLRLAQAPQNIPGLAYAYFSNASNFLQQTRYKEAEPPSRESLRLRTAKFGSASPVLIPSLNQLAGITRSLDCYTESEGYLEAADKIANGSKVSPSQIAATQIALGLLRRSQGRFDEAENLLRQALSTREQQYGSDHRNVAAAASELGRVLEEKGNFSDAESLYRRALTFRLRRYGNDSPITARSYNSLGRLYMKQSAPNEAYQLFEMALTSVESKLGDVSLTAVIKLNFGSLLLHSDHERGRAMLNSALKIFMRQLGEKHHYTKEARELLHE